MRLGLLLLAFLVVLSSAAEAQSRARPGAGFRSPRASSAALEAARRYLCPNGGTPQGRGRCSAGRGVGMLGSDPEVRGWDRGLVAPSREQAPCPPGTVASRAIAQPNVTRCIAS